MGLRTRTACVGLEAHRTGGDQITCELCGQTLEAKSVWRDPVTQKRYTADMGYFREYHGLVLRCAS